MILNGNALQIPLAADSIDTVITDPPYGLGFMGKLWDHGVPGVSFWQDALRVAKPGAILLAFGGTRTHHRLMCAIEDAGWWIRNVVMWVYGSGFPKSHDISKAIDKIDADPGRLHKFTAWMRTTGIKARDIDTATETNMGGHYLTARSQPAIPTPELWAIIRPMCTDVPDWVDKLVERIEAEREIVRTDTKARSTSGKSALPTLGGETIYQSWDITAPATPDAQLWHGYGTALKPAWEPIIVAMKPLDGTFAQNALKWGVAGLWVDGGRVFCDGGSPSISIRATERNRGKSPSKPGCYDRPLQDRTTHETRTTPRPGEELGRWPANLIHDGSDEVMELFPVSNAQPVKPENIGRSGDGDNKGIFKLGSTVQTGYYDTETSAARFFYCAKASPAERGEGNNHPTVKPLALMRYLCRLTKTPTGGIVLDPFCGSGSTGIAAKLEGRDFIGLDISAEYCQMARRRVNEYFCTDAIDEWHSGRNDIESVPLDDLPLFKELSK